MEIQIAKTAHILSAFLLCGAGFGLALRCLASRVPRQMHVMLMSQSQLVLLDCLFTMPALVLQPLTGFWLAIVAGVPLTAPWMEASLALYAVTLGCNFAALWLQGGMLDTAEAALRGESELSARYHRHYRAWNILGWPAFAATLAITVLMVVRPEW
ncbi:MAG: DUF2269 domain-containing protein [Acetobacteraceae bacterium]|nr:DUF2269 domain-containing protein [Acetobacteraceae bacterium]